MNVLSVHNLVKEYGNIRALNNISFSVPDNCVFGILGPNGSGKTTLLGIVLNILQANSGEVLINEQKPTADTRKKIGTLLETPNFYHYLTAMQNLLIAAEIKGNGKNDIEAVLHTVNLYERRNSKFSTYSLGMKQRLAIASALLGDPQILIFDEPTNGLDPVGIAEIRSLITNLAARGKTIIMASHLLDEVEKVCTHVAILQRGNLLVSGAVDEVLVTDEVAEVGAKKMDELEPVLQRMGGYIKLSKHNGLFQLSYAAGCVNLEQINAYCFEKGIVINHLLAKKKSLETKFLELTNS